MKKTLREVSRELYRSLGSLKSEFDGQERFDGVFGALCEVAKPAVTEKMDGTGGTAAIEVEVENGWESGDAIGRLEAAIRQLEVIYETLMEHEHFDEAKEYRDHAEKLKRALKQHERK